MKLALFAILTLSFAIPEMVLAERYTGPLKQCNRNELWSHLNPINRVCNNAGTSFDDKVCKSEMIGDEMDQEHHKNGAENLENLDRIEQLERASELNAAYGAQDDLSQSEKDQALENATRTAKMAARKRSNCCEKLTKEFSQHCSNHQRYQTFIDKSRDQVETHKKSSDGLEQLRQNLKKSTADRTSSPAPAFPTEPGMVKDVNGNFCKVSDPSCHPDHDNSAVANHPNPSAAGLLQGVAPFEGAPKYPGATAPVGGGRKYFHNKEQWRRAGLKWNDFLQNPEKFAPPEPGPAPTGGGRRHYVQKEQHRRAKIKWNNYWDEYNDLASKMGLPAKEKQVQMEEVSTKGIMAPSEITSDLADTSEVESSRFDEIYNQ